MNILIVDDEQTALNDLERVLLEVIPTGIIKRAQSARDALILCGAKMFDIVFLDINMPGMGGMELARRLKISQPRVNIVIVTAYTEYAIDAHQMYVSGYLLKPVLRQDVVGVLANLRYPVIEKTDGLFVRCFGNFDVFYDNKPVSFGRTKAKEMFAYLIDRRGAGATNRELRAILWGDVAASQQSYFSQISYSLRKTLGDIGCIDVLAQKRNSYAIRPEEITCDYYQALSGDTDVISQFEGEYMSQYEWAEARIGRLLDEFGR